MQQTKIKDELIEQMNTKFELERAREIAEKEFDLKLAVRVTEKEKAQDQAVKDDAKLDK